MPRLAPLALLAAAALLAQGCGYHLVQGYRAKGGADRVQVGAFENDSVDPELGALVTAALREELARRGALGEAGAPARLEGTIRASEGVPSTPNSTTFRVAVEVRARLQVAGRGPEEVTVRREAEHLAGADALEAEGRRAMLLRRLATDVAHELLVALEAPQDAPAPQRAP
ncbi:MAG: LPS assembly lipoprotein LptE [Anaeromyxobacter sp.]